MTLKDIAKQLTTAVQTVPNLVQILRDGLEQAEAGSDVEVTQVVSSGTKIASVKVGEETTDLYAPDNEAVYSTTEKIIGKWIDGSDIYQIVITVSSAVNVTKNVWTTIFTDEFIGSISQLIECAYINTSNGGVYNAFQYKCSGNNLQCLYLEDISISANVNYVLTYIKSSS